MKKVGLVTNIRFWREDGGHKSRILALAKYLGKSTQLTCVVAHQQEAIDQRLLKQRGYDFEVHFLEPHRELSIPEYTQLFVQYVDQHPMDVYIIEYIQLAFITQFIPKGATLILDTHDLMSDREKSFKQFGHHHEKMSFEEELAIFRRFDHVLLIQAEEHQKVAQRIGMDRAVLVPHPVAFTQQPIRREVQNIGFIGNAYLPNEEGIEWFLEQVWPLVDKEKIHLHIYGNVFLAFTGRRFEQVTFHGFVEDINTVYTQSDIMINPVHFGAGLKIKNIEALGNGLPLITTSHSARGLRCQEEQAFLIADSATAFVEQIELLRHNYEKRKALGHTAYEWIKNSFSEAQCFGPLLKAIQQASSMIT